MSMLKMKVKNAFIAIEDIVLKVKDAVNAIAHNFKFRSSNLSVTDETPEEVSKMASPSTLAYEYTETRQRFCSLYTSNYNGTTCIQQRFCSGNKCSCCTSNFLLTNCLKSLFGMIINCLCYPFIPCAVAFLPASFQFAGYSNTNSLYPCYGKTCCLCVRDQEAGFSKLCCSPLSLLIWISLILVTAFYTLWKYTQQTSLLIEALLYFEDIDEATSVTLFIILFTLVSFPVMWGYVILNLAAGYLYGFWLGLLVVVISVTCGLTIAHVVCKRYLATCVMNLLRKRSNFDQIEGILQVVDGKSGLKVITLTRLTPIPFGFQNGLFAVSNVSLKYYLLASDVGLLPTQMLNCYIASKFRSIEQIVGEDSQKNYLIFLLQVAIGIALTVFVVQKARKELATALQNSDKAQNSLSHHEDVIEDIVASDAPDGDIRLTQPSSMIKQTPDCLSQKKASSIVIDI